MSCGFSGFGGCGFTSSSGCGGSDMKIPISSSGCGPTRYLYVSEHSSGCGGSYVSFSVDSGGCGGMEPASSRDIMRAFNNMRRNHNNY